MLQRTLVALDRSESNVLHHAPCSVIIVQGIFADAEALQEYLDSC